MEHTFFWDSKIYDFTPMLRTPPDGSLKFMYNENNRLVYDYDKQEFSGVSFQIKIETIRPKLAQLSFIKLNSRISIPPGIIFYDKTNNQNETPMPGSNIFPLQHGCEYHLHYDTNSNRRKNANKFCTILCKNKDTFFIYNLKKRDVLNEERERREREREQIRNEERVRAQLEERERREREELALEFANCLDEELSD
ncbi:13563_t:CDS:2 [Cetraspora pellucida]|uniref:13563_t:CDS:1 n=1 Tax=Cetraspora pellucida TaxID=1433469 RepID=A0A9N9BIC3_9GLOM|nr:13563_t:CDS:2 [Cetraspora pellucida]